MDHMGIRKMGFLWNLFQNTSALSTGIDSSTSKAPLIYPSSSTGASRAPSLEEQLQDLQVSVQAPTPTAPFTQNEMRKIHKEDEFWTAECSKNEKMVEEAEKQREAEEQREIMKEGWHIDKVNKTVWKLDGKARKKFCAKELGLKVLEKDEDEEEKRG
ncbi:hypothetical protein B9Z55_028465 [Caenorhabditis nigoni]|uniref:Uncharacterized protein n=2 Tax=Caenorhabditis nigoni TaxID=1611254 RepID=A0A2G5SB52_9PELO|nr:hypothetical protein B9Z55_028465 [Caenorhabditis nigoni]